MKDGLQDNTCVEGRGWERWTHIEGHYITLVLVKGDTGLEEGTDSGDEE